MSRIHIFITGFVQGVFYRAETQSKAQYLGLPGWVRNLPDGRVEAVFEGPKDKLNQIIVWCRSGPAAADVKSVEVVWEESEKIKGFEIK